MASLHAQQRERLDDLIVDLEALQELITEDRDHFLDLAEQAADDNDGEPEDQDEYEDYKYLAEAVHEVEAALAHLKEI